MNKWKDIPYSGVRKLNIVKILVLPKGIYRIKEIPMQIPVITFLQNRKPHFKFHMESKGLCIAKMVQEKNKF